MPETTISRSSPRTGTVLPQGRPFWIVDGRAYDFTEWMGRHPGGATWFQQTQGRDISALLHTYHREPARLQKILAKYQIDDFTEQDLLPQLGVPPFLLAPDFDARTDMPRLDYSDGASLLAEIRRKVNARFSRKDLRRYDRAFDAVTWAIGIAHVATLALLIANVIPAWAFVIIMVLTRTALAGAGHYQIHRKWKQQRSRSFTLPMGKALFDINYVGTSLIGTDGHVLLHHPYLGSGADVKKTFFDSMLRLHPVLRIPGYTLHKLGISLTGLSLRAREISKFEHPSAKTQGGTPSPRDASRADFWLIRALIVAEFALCLGTGHVLAWLVQFFLTLWFNTFLVVASHDFEEETTEEELAVIPEPLRNDWAAQQICLSYDLSVVGNRWIDLFLSAGLSPHRVHHVLPWQGSGFANLASEASVREACAEVGIGWERPRNLIFGRFPAVIKHYLLRPAKAARPQGEFPMPPPPPGQQPMQPPPDGAFPMPPPPPGSVPVPPARSVMGQIAELFRYTLDGFKGVGV
jgi:Cytochrome b5-like Heme/Steroid binding domain/Fatty acid desaturase